MTRLPLDGVTFLRTVLVEGQGWTDKYGNVAFATAWHFRSATYVSLGRVAGEGTIGAITYGGVLYAVHVKVSRK